MKTKFLMLGFLVAALCLPSCNDDSEVTVSNITVSPSSISAMEVGETVELTANVTPDNATEDIRWEIYDPTIVSIENQGRKAILKAVASGTTRIFATNKTGIVVSEEITVKVNSSEYAKFVAGNYMGTAEVRGALNIDLSGVQVKLERIADENAQVKLTLVAEVPGMGELAITGESVVVSPVAGELETYAFKGLSEPAPPLNAPLNISGKYSTTDKALTLALETDGLSIHVTAAPGTPTDYGALVAGDYVGNAQLTGLMSADLSGVQVTLARTGSSKVSLVIAGEAPGIGAVRISGEDITVAAGSQPGTCSFSGKAALPPPMAFDLNVTGTFNTLTHELTLTLTEVSGLINIDLVAMPPGFDPSNYAALVEGKYLGDAKLTGALEADLSGVQIALERVDNGTAKINVTANVPGLGEVTLTGNAIAVSEGAEANTYALSGTATASLGEFSVTGTYDVTGHTLVLKLASAVAVIEVTAAKVEEEPPSTSYAELVVGDYSGEAVITGAINETLPGTPVKLELIAGQTDAVKFTIEATVPSMGKMTITSESLAIAPGETADTYQLSGEATIPSLANLPLTITGTFDASDGTLNLSLVAAVVTISYSGSR